MNPAENTQPERGLSVAHGSASWVGVVIAGLSIVISGASLSISSESVAAITASSFVSAIGGAAILAGIQKRCGILK